MGSQLTLSFFLFCREKNKEAMNGSLARGRTDWNIRACSVDEEERKRGAEND